MTDQNTLFDLLALKHHTGVDEKTKITFTSYKALILKPVKDYEFNGTKGGGAGMDVSEIPLTQEVFEKIFIPDMKCFGRKISFIHDVVPAKKGFTTIICDAKII